MIDFQQILEPACVSVGNPAKSKKRALEHASELIVAAHPEIPSRRLFDQLMARERLGSTGLGEGIAIPHCRLDECHEIVGALVRLESPVPFEAIDGEPVDLLFVLVVPTDAHDAHLKVLAELARVFGEDANRKRLREAPDAAALFDVLLSMLSPAGNPRSS